MNGSGTFNGQILIDKLAKLNSSQQSIETLSHWCIFHRRKAEQVVETWERQFYCSPRDQRVSFLYLANDILQNSRRRGMEFVGEFWKVLPDALHDVIENGDELGKKAALRLVDIWEERKVFNPRGQTLKEDLLGRNKNGRIVSYKLKQPTGDVIEKLISSYRLVYDGFDEETLLRKCKAAISSIEKMEKDIGGDFSSGNINGSGFADELQTQHGLLRECVNQLKVVESSRKTLISHLREAINEQELKLEELHNQLQVAQLLYEQVERLLTGAPPPPPPPPEQDLDEIPPPPPDSAYSEAPPPPNFPPDLPSGTSSQTANEERKSAAADVAAKLTSSTSSAQVLSYVLSNLASEGVISQSMSEEFPSDSNKRPRISSGGFGNVPFYLPQPQQPPPPLFPHPDSMHQPLAPPLMPPLQPPVPPVPYNFGSPPMPGYPMVTLPPFPGPPNPFSFQTSDAGSGGAAAGAGGGGGGNGGFFGQPQYPVAPPPNSQQ